MEAILASVCRIHEQNNSDPHHAIEPTEEMASCSDGFGFLLADVPNIRFILTDGGMNG